MRKSILMALGATALATTSAANATAFVGSTGGCFGASCTPMATATTTSGGATLNFTSGTFNQMDSNGFVAIGSGNPPTDTLGLFSLTGTTGTSSFNTPFTLLVSFTSPTGVTPASAGTFFSTITGSVTDGNAGGVFVDFDNTLHAFNSNSGPFTLRVNDLNVSNGGVLTPITGQINATAVPEAKTWAMMLFGFAGIGFAMRRRRRPTLAQVA